MVSVFLKKLLEETKTGESIMMDGSARADTDKEKISSETEEHVEYVAGTYVKKDFTSPRHNSIVQQLIRSFAGAIADDGSSCVTFSDTVPLYYEELLKKESDTDKTHYYLPDFMLVCPENSEDGIRDDGVHLVPEFVAEITSPATKKDDYGEKMSNYQLMGVKEYWIIDLQKDVLVIHSIDPDAPLKIQPLAGEHSVYVSGGRLTISF